MDPLATTPSPGIRHGIACLILLALPLQALAAAHLHGVVRKNELGGEPLALVAVSSPDANPSSSDSQGRFRLGFPRLEPGEKVALDVKLKGWVVVNDLQLEDRILPRDARANPVTFLLARPEEKLRWALVYYRLKGRENVDAEYRKRLAELERNHQSTARERDQLARERDPALAQAEEHAKQLVALQPGDGDALYREATRLYLDNRLDEALRLLDEKKLQDSAAQAGKLEANARKLRQETSRNWRLRGKLLAQRFQFAAAGSAYAAATQLTPEDFDAWFDYAKFHQELNRFEEARQGYEKALQLARKLARANP
ncbi:MAG: hypothetical protein Q8Q28_13640 [Pseudomonadota bacterium]|nr:hypothetical protein [Pseudomonadota bacterium]